MTGKIPVARQDLGLWKGDIAVDLPGIEEPKLSWKGAKIKTSLVLEIVSFFRHANEKWKSEAQLRLAYSPGTMEWRAVALPQHVGTGMTSNEIKTLDAEGEALRDKAMSELGPGFVLNGTAHSHCDCGAFASSVDKHDEISQNGLHLTFGKISSIEIEIHGRVTLRGIEYAIAWDEWFEAPPARDEKNESLATLAIPADFVPSFPESWLASCKEREEPKYGFEWWKDRRGAAFDSDFDYDFDTDCRGRRTRPSKLKDSDCALDGEKSEFAKCKLADEVEAAFSKSGSETQMDLDLDLRDAKAARGESWRGKSWFSDEYAQLTYEHALEEGNSEAFATHMARFVIKKLALQYDEEATMKEELNKVRDFAVDEFVGMTFKLLNFCEELEMPLGTLKRCLDDVLSFSLDAYRSRPRYANPKPLVLPGKPRSGP